MIAASKYFSASLGPNFQEGSKSEFTLDGTDGETVKAIVDFCYTGRVDLTEENVDDFMAIASSVEFDLLEEKCCRFYAEELNVMNSISTLMVADKYCIADLRQRALDFICGSFEKVPATDIQRLDFRLLHEVLKNDNIEATEELVFKRLMEWFQEEETEREKHMPELLQLVRLEQIPSEVPFFRHQTLKTIFRKHSLEQITNSNSSTVFQ